ARLGTDAAFDEGQMKIGRRLAIKLLNAARFALSFDMPKGVTEVSEPIDKAMLARLGQVIETATQAFDSYDHTKALETTETFFWTFTDDYLELVKERAYSQEGYSPEEIGSAVLALRQALGVLVRLLAPFLPFAAEEVWSWWQEGSVHQAAWPVAEEISGESPELLTAASEALIAIRKSKTDQKLSMKAEISNMVLAGPAILNQAQRDLAAVGRIQNLELNTAEKVLIESMEFAEQQ
ncbi:MAG: class I tRNA ligase family protein, partial [Aquiluna sp.]